MSSQQLTKRTDKNTVQTRANTPRLTQATPAQTRADSRLSHYLRPGVLIAAAVILLVLAWAAFPGIFTGANPLLGEPNDRLSAPGDGYLLGSDHLGRDLYARLVYGTATSLGTTLAAVAIAFLAGTLLGLASGFIGGTLDTGLMRIIDVLQSIPGLLLSMAVVTALGFGPLPIAFAVALAAIPAFTRLTRGEVLRWRSTLFVEAARLNGISNAGIMFRHVLPHVAGPVLSLAALEFGNAILAVSALSFLGYGAPAPQPEWGLLIAEGRDYMGSAWWLTTVPGLVIAAVVLSINYLARTLHTERRPA